MSVLSCLWVCSLSKFKFNLDKLIPTLSFKIDVSSPGYIDAQEEKLDSEEEVDYEILSKQLENP